MKTIQQFQEFHKQWREGDVTADQVRQAFASIVENEAEFKESMKALKKKELARYAPHRLSEKKDALIRIAYGGVLQIFVPGDSFSYSYGEKLSDVIAALLDQWTDEKIQADAESLRRRSEAFRKSIENPETIEEIQNFVHYRGIDALPKEKRRFLEDHLATKSRKESKEDQERLYRQRVARYQAASAEATFSDVIESTHTKHGHALFVIRLLDRVERDVYRSLNERAKTLGGRYSSYTRDGAIPGFQFRERESAEAFKSANESNDRAVERRAERQDDTAEGKRERLRALADRLEDRGNESLGHDRKENTHKRAREAASAIATANNTIAKAETLRRIAGAQEAGSIHLEGLSNLAQLEELFSILNLARWARIRAEQLNESEIKGEPYCLDDVDFVEMPENKYWLDTCLSLKIQLGNTRKAGAVEKSLAARIRRTKGDKVSIRWDLLAKIRDKLGELPWQFDYTWQRRERLRRMNIHNNNELRAALRELIGLAKTPEQESTVAKMERDLIGSCIPGFFPTPKPIIERMLDYARIEPGQTVLEPSAGRGDILDAIAERCEDVKVSVCEINATLRELLAAKGHEIQGRDFMDLNGELGLFDRVVMNPPFENGQDIEHIRHAFDKLNPGGRLVAICANGSKQNQTLKPWIEELGGEWYDLPQGSFQTSGTGTNTALVVVEKE